MGEVSKNEVKKEKKYELRVVDKVSDSLVDDFYGIKIQKNGVGNQKKEQSGAMVGN